MDTHVACQVVDYNGSFLHGQLQKFIRECKVEDKTGIRVVSILGPQSSGKSTLLNLLFGTNFSVMTAVTGPAQTTKGIWLAQARKLDSVLVMDVEGTDSTERGGHALDYERKTSLFSIALSEVVIINLWSHDIGRQNAANLPLLRMVFEVNLQVFQEADAPKTIILFVIRDHVSSTTSLEVLSERIMKDMKAIWSQISKPAQWASAAVTDVFDFTFNSLSHFVLEPDNFQRDCNILQERFYNYKSKHYLFRRAHPKTIVSGGFPEYAKGIWETILENRNLDLPAQKQILSLHRCTDTLNQAYNMFLEDWRVMLTTANDGKVLPHFEDQISKSCKRTFGLYEMVTLGYHTEVREKKGEELRTKVIADLRQLVDLQVANQIKVMKEAFRQRFERALQKESNPANAAAEAKEAGLSAGPDPRTLSSPDIDPVVVQVCKSAYVEAQNRFLNDVENECLRAMLDFAMVSKEQSEKRAQKATEDARSLQSTLEQERSALQNKVVVSKQEMAMAQERIAACEEDARAQRKRAEKAEADLENIKAHHNAELSLRTRELQDALESSKQHKQAANAAQAEVQRITDDLATTKKVLEAETKTLREEFQTANRKASESEARYLNMKEEARSDRERCAELEKRMAVLTETVTSQAQALVALAEERESVTGALSKQNAFLAQKANESTETLQYYEKIINGNREELMDLRDKLAAAADYGENTGLNYRKALSELEELKHRNADLFNENQYLIQLLNQKQSEFYEEYRRSLHERQIMAARLDDMERMRSVQQSMYVSSSGSGPIGVPMSSLDMASTHSRRKVTMDTSVMSSQPMQQRERTGTTTVRESSATAVSSSKDKDGSNMRQR